MGIDAGASSIRVKPEWPVVSRLHYRVRFGWDRARGEVGTNPASRDFL